MHFRREKPFVRSARQQPGAIRPLVALALAATVAGLLSVASESHASPSTPGNVTVLCGSSPPLASGYTGHSPAGPCEGVCYSGWTDGSCNDPVDSQSYVVVYGCAGKTSGNGYSCDGDHNGGVLLATLSAGEEVSLSSFTSDWNYCTFQIDVLRPNGGDPIGLRDFIVWEREDCSPPPPSCYCPDGTDYQGNPITSTTCGEQVCGADYKWYSCQESGWNFEGGTCNDPPGCNCTGSDYQGNPVTLTTCGEQVCGGDFQWYSCEDTGWIAQGGTCPGGATWTAVSAGGYHTCGLRSDGTAQCWGDDTSGQAPALISGTFSQISAGFDFTCGLRTDGDIECWGSDVYGQAPSYRAGPFTSVSAGVTHTCALTASGGIDCWGNMDGSAPAGTYAQVLAGGSHTCALRTDGTVTCWGYDGFGQVTGPSGTFVQFSVGGTTSCGLRANGDVECWGQDTSGQATAPAGQFSQVSTGYIHTCGVKSDGQLTCWGDSYQGLLNSPGGTFTQVSAGGGYHNCALSTSGEVACWGLNSSGQLNVPQ